VLFEIENVFAGCTPILVSIGLLHGHSCAPVEIGAGSIVPHNILYDIKSTNLTESTYSYQQ
jgi:hypothetical protein